MITALQWETLVFLAPLVSAALLLVGIAFGGGEGDGDPDGPGVHGHDHHAGHDTAHGLDGSHSTMPSPLAFLGVGQVPMGLVLVSLLSTFGAVGFATSLLLRGVTGASGTIGIVAGLLAALFGTRWMSRLVARLLPSRESYNVKKADLIGRSGHAHTEVTATDGFVQLTDHEGNLHQVRARSTGATIPKGSTLLLVDREALRDTYVVEPFDPEAPADSGPASRTNSPVAGGRAPNRQE